MGQRLIIINKINSEKQNAIYYHYAGYTYSAINELIKLRDAVTKELEHKQVQNATTLEEMFNVACFEAVSGTPRDMPNSVKYITPLLSHPLDDRKVHRNFGLAVFSKVDINFFIEVGDVFATIDWVFDENNQVNVSKTQVTFNALATATVEEEVEYYGLSDEELEQRKSYAPDINYTYPINDIESFRDQLISITDRGTIPYWYDKESNKFVQVIE